MNAFIEMTGPHPSQVRRRGKPASIWRVAVVSGDGREPQSTIYKVFTYRRAVGLACDMARDRRLFLHMEAVPE